MLSIISIHVLREEDDSKWYDATKSYSYISIHVLREEDDEIGLGAFTAAGIFLSTSSARRTTLGV